MEGGARCQVPKVHKPLARPVATSSRSSSSDCRTVVPEGPFPLRRQDSKGEDVRTNSDFIPGGADIGAHGDRVGHVRHMTLPIPIATDACSEAESAPGGRIGEGAGGSQDNAVQAVISFRRLLPEPSGIAPQPRGLSPWSSVRRFSSRESSFAQRQQYSASESLASLEKVPYSELSPSRRRVTAVGPVGSVSHVGSWSSAGHCADVTKAGGRKRPPNLVGIPESRFSTEKPVDEVGRGSKVDAFAGKPTQPPLPGLVGIDRVLANAPQSVWQPNMVVARDRRLANCCWALLLLGYLFYVMFVIYANCERRKSPPIAYGVTDSAFELPDIAFCFEDDDYGSRFGCFDEANGEDCAASFAGNVSIFGYDEETHSTQGYNTSEDYVVLLPDTLTETCPIYRLSSLSALKNAPAWKIQMLFSWNSSYDSSQDTGVFESIRMYLYQGGSKDETIDSTQVALYVPISLDATDVPLLRGFLTYEEYVDLKGSTKRRYSVEHATTSSWRNAEDALELTSTHGTDALASIHLDIRSLSYYRYEEIDPVDIAGTMGQISGFWLVVPFLFGLLFYRPRVREDWSRRFSLETLPWYRPAGGQINFY